MANHFTETDHMKNPSALLSRKTRDKDCTKRRIVRLRPQPVKAGSCPDLQATLLSILLSAKQLLLKLQESLVIYDANARRKMRVVSQGIMTEKPELGAPARSPARIAATQKPKPHKVATLGRLYDADGRPANKLVASRHQKLPDQAKGTHSFSTMLACTAAKFGGLNQRDPKEIRPTVDKHVGKMRRGVRTVGTGSRRVSALTRQPQRSGRRETVA